MPTICEIEFENNPNKVFFTGELVRGVVSITLSKKQMFKAIFIQFSGKSVTGWWTLEESFSSEQIFFNQQLDLIEKSTGNFIVCRSFYLHWKNLLVEQVKFVWCPQHIDTRLNFCYQMIYQPQWKDHMDRSDTWLALCSKFQSCRIKNSNFLSLFLKQLIWMRLHHYG